MLGWGDRQTYWRNYWILYGCWNAASITLQSVTAFNNLHQRAVHMCKLSFHQIFEGAHFKLLRSSCNNLQCSLHFRGLNGNLQVYKLKIEEPTPITRWYYLQVDRTFREASNSTDWWPYWCHWPAPPPPRVNFSQINWNNNLDWTFHSCEIVWS